MRVPLFESSTNVCFDHHKQAENSEVVKGGAIESVVIVVREVSFASIGSTVQRAQQTKSDLEAQQANTSRAKAAPKPTD